MPQIEIWALPDKPLKKTDILENGYKSLEDYIYSLTKTHNYHQKAGCRRCLRVSSEPLVSFGTFNPSTGQKVVKLLCQTFDDLPTESIEDVLIM